MPEKKSPLFFAGTSHPELAGQIAKEMKLALGKIEIEKFPDGEIGVQLLENVQGRDVVVLQTIARHPNHYLMELLLIADALRRASARRIIAAIPYLGYARQDRKEGNGPIAAKVVASALERGGIDHLLTVDLHAEQIQGFFGIPVENLYARPLLLKRVADVGDVVVVTPDLGRVKLARAFAEDLKADFAVVDKRRVSAKQVEARALVGDVRGKDVLLVDDICSTGETLKMASLVCQKAGAKRIFAAVTHGLMMGSALESGAIDKMWITNTAPSPSAVKKPILETVSVAPLLAQAILAI